MSIIVTSTPATYSTVYNPIYTSVISSLTTEESFNFIFDTYVNGTYVTRNLLQPKPGTIGTEFSPAGILESYVSYDLTHNIIDETSSQNCIKDFEIHVGEEFILYWSFLDTQYDSYSTSSYTLLQGTSSSTHGYVVGDYIIVENTTYGTYNGVHKVVGVPNNYSVVIDKTFITTPTNPGRTTWSDKRKFEILDYELLPDGTFQSISNWTQYGPDADLNTIENGTPGYLNWSQRVSGTFVTKYTEAVGVTLVPGLDYRVTYRVFDTYPSLGSQQTYVDLGGNRGATNSGVGLFTEDIKCGAGNKLRLFGSCTASGLQGITFTSISLKLAPIKGYFFNGVLSYEELPEWDYTQYKLDGSTKKFLTNQPSTVKTKLEDRGSIGFMNINTPLYAGSNLLVVDGIDNTGSPTYPLTFTLSTFGDLTPTNNQIIELPAYPWNLNQLSQSIFGIDVISSGNRSYSLAIYNYDGISTFTQLSEWKTFELDTTCSKYEPVRFMFLNSLGQFDFFNATLLSRTNISVSRDTYTKTLTSGYTQGDRGKTVLNVNAQENYTVTTNWVSEATAHWLSYEFVTSEEVYVLDNTTGKITPIILNISDWEDKKQINDKLLNYTITYSKAVGVNTKRN